MKAIKDRLAHYKLDTNQLIQRMTNAPDLTPAKWDEVYFYSDNETNQNRINAK